ncbi:hypothetical protein [Methylobacillus rhizosphaerae]|uniref:hypothetical protein n=1 Tax=Methylobacillus rhizosphaerae TaxID=551994 RepID=UPI0015C5D8BA|nr:hypothetical protein [Methylobacillus rhizosphaerae]
MRWVHGSILDQHRPCPSMCHKEKQQGKTLPLNPQYLGDTYREASIKTAIPWRGFYPAS